MKILCPIVVRIAYKTARGWRAEYFRCRSVEEAQRFADRRYAKFEHEVQFDESQQERLLGQSESFKEV